MELLTERAKEHAASLTELHSAAKGAGYDADPPLDIDRIEGRIVVRGPRTGYRHRFGKSDLEHVTMREFIEHREDVLEARGYALPKDLGYSYDVDRDDDGDRYFYDHFLIKDGKMIRLDAPSTCRDLDADELALHIILGFPRRADLGKMGPLRRPDLERAIFG